jgi:hypothetical protein
VRSVLYSNLRTLPLLANIIMAESNTANNGYNGLTSKIVIPYFNPSETKISAKAWIGYVEMARDSAGTKPVKNANGEEIQVSNWSDKQTVTNAMLLLQGTANKWVEHIFWNPEALN